MEGRARRVQVQEGLHGREGVVVHGRRGQERFARRDARPDRPDALLGPRMAAFAADATAAAAPPPGSEASVTASFWTRYFQDRTVLLESGPLETRLAQDTDALEELLRHSFGFQRLQKRMVSSEQPEP